MDTGRRYRQQGDIGLFDNEETKEKLNAMGDSLAKLAGVIAYRKRLKM